MFKFIIKQTIKDEYVNEWSEELFVKYLKEELPPHMRPSFDKAWKNVTRKFKEAILKVK